MGKKGMDAEMVRQMLEAMPKHVREELENLRYKAETAGDLVSFAMVGPCPKCGNELTMDGDDAGDGSGMGDTTVGVCPECDTTWCLECGQTLESWPCQHWAVWEAHCKKKGICQDDDTCMSMEYQEAYQAWLEEYMESAAKSTQSKNGPLRRLAFWLAQRGSRRREGK